MSDEVTASLTLAAVFAVSGVIAWMKRRLLDGVALFDPRVGDVVEWWSSGAHVRGTFARWHLNEGVFVVTRSDGSLVNVGLWQGPRVVERRTPAQEPGPTTYRDSGGHR